MIGRKAIEKARLRRKLRVRKKIFGTPLRPRISVYRSLKHTYAQIIDDTIGHTLVSCSTLDPQVRNELAEKKISSKSVEAAKLVGLYLAKRALEAGIKKVVFCRGRYKYHGRVKAVAEGAREGGLEF